jgi:molecular chaperone DnaK (HSP70)
VLQLTAASGSSPKSVLLASVGGADNPSSSTSNSGAAEGTAYLSASAAELIETSPRSIGIAAYSPDLRFCTTLKRNAHYPATESEIYTNAHDNQPSIEIKIYRRA